MRESGEEWEKDVRALEYVIKELERTAQEVPVQEQLANEISNGYKTINHARKLYNLEPIENGNILTTKL